jgi:mannose-6-phosphate isomerase-like protein (cupin superfamily)
MTTDAPTPPPASDDAAPSVVPVDLRDYVDFSPDRARRVRVLATSTVTLDLWCLEPQQATTVLAYPDADVAYTVLGGRAWFVTEEGEVGLDPMGAVLVPAGVHHGLDNRGTDPLIAIASMSPPDAAPPSPPVEQRYAAIRTDDGGRGRISRALGKLLGGDR